MKDGSEKFFWKLFFKLCSVLSSYNLHIMENLNKHLLALVKMHPPSSTSFVREDAFEYHCLPSGFVLPHSLGSVVPWTKKKIPTLYKCVCRRQQWFFSCQRCWWGNKMDLSTELCSASLPQNWKRRSESNSDWLICLLWFSLFSLLPLHFLFHSSLMLSFSSSSSPSLSFILSSFLLKIFFCHCVWISVFTSRIWEDLKK